MVERLLMRSSWRFFTRHPWQLWLTLLSIALGTAVIIAVDLANATANRSFRQSVTTLVGPMTHEITARNNGFAEDYYRQLRMQAGYRAAVPQVEGRIAIDTAYYTLLGVDPIAYLDLPIEANRLPVEGLPDDALSTLIAEPGSVILSQTLARRLGASAGEQLSIRVDGRRGTLQVIAVVEVEDAARRDVILTDIATAQMQLGKLGQLSRVQLVLDEQQAESLKARLPPKLELISYKTREQGFSQMTEAFRVNLTAMSLLAMLVGAFLVYNTMTFSVLQRRQTFAVTRMLGTRGAQLFRHMLLEALILGVVGSALGLVLGVIMGQGLLVLVTQTISDLYVTLELSEIKLSPWLIVKGIAITLAAVLAATVGPAMEAARVQPVLVYRRSHLEQARRRISGALLLVGLVLLGLSALLLNVASRNLIWGFTALFIFIMGYSFLIPAVLQALLTGLRRSGVFRGLNQRMMLRGVQSSLSRTTLAIIALTVAVSATVGVGIMIGSFRASVADWLDTTLESDIYISARTREGAEPRGALGGQWLERVRKLEGVESVSTGYDTQLEYAGIPIPLLVMQPGKQSPQGFEFLQGEHRRIWHGFENDTAVIVSEPFAYHHRLRRGDTLRLSGADGSPVELSVAGVFRDYSASHGMIVIRRSLYERYWDIEGFTSIGLMLSDDADADALKAKLQGWAARSQQPVLVRYNEEIKAYSLKVFDRTFAITNVLRILVVIVAFVGVFSALMALFLEKTREFAILRATGFTPGRLRLLVLSEAGFIGLIAGMLSLPLGFIMSDILIEVINRRAFGWSMTQHFFAGIPLQALLLAMVAAVLAGLYPTIKISRVSLREGLRSL